MSSLQISNLVLWVLQVATILIVIGLARQVGLLHLRLPPRGPGRLDEGPPVGAQLELSVVKSMRGVDLQLLAPERLTLITFANPGCSLCGPMMDAAKRLAGVERDIHFVSAVDGEHEAALRYVSAYGLGDAVSTDDVATLSGKSRPFALVLNETGVVLASGVPNNLEQLEDLLGLARGEQHRHGIGEVSESGSVAVDLGEPDKATYVIVSDDRQPAGATHGQ